jgi:L,D-peptidoglycan transpeptidase YkuD (ErfK/YbiS/YcfS/YnhG family)
MFKTALTFCCCFAFLATVFSQKTTPKTPLPLWQTELKTEQIIVVVAPNETAKTAIMRCYERRGKRWKPLTNAYTTVKIGRNGLAWGKGLHAPSFNKETMKREGDGKAPQGIFRLTQLFGYQETPDKTWKMPYIYAKKSTLCIDDIDNTNYCQIIDSTAAQQPKSYEKMRRNDHLYKYGVVVDYNMSKTEKGGGSCIFMHLQTADAQPTAGCTAMLEKDMTTILKFLNAKKQPVLLQCTTENYAALAKYYGLPLEWGKVMQR